ncbi:hypothetical protein [uncultured Alistipes sp.]|uniref:hypothetical protein n=1 Tax=uncultured Alistipes sp. TaxID=538949 RepID=UPI0025EBD03E|nr:hypothetical protein [uncultured Alistipes sp.]
MGKKLHCIFLLASCLTMVCSSCVDDPVDDTSSEGDVTVLCISNGSADETRAYVGTDPSRDDPMDFMITTLRVMAFDSGGQCVSNVLYNASRGDIIRHKIEADTYDFVFIANEPFPAASSPLNGVGNYTGLQGINYSGAEVNSFQVIPMVQEIKSVEVLTQSAGAKISGATYNPLVLSLSRLATRVDVVLKAKEDISSHFKGVSFSNVPDQVPALSDNNGSVTRTTTRSFTIASDGSYFTALTPTAAEQAQGVVWKMQVRRIILPFSNFTPANTQTKAIEFTLDMQDRYSPSCLLQKMPGDYTLPRDVALLLTGNVQIPLELNIQVSPWGKEEDDWQVQDRYLNVSQIAAEITDFNGARITFSSNLPKVYVEPTLTGSVKVSSNAAEPDVSSIETGKVFNDLILLPDWDTPRVDGTKTTYSTSRFSYTYDSSTKTGTGYMDILLDEYNLWVTTQTGLPQAVTTAANFDASYPNGRRTDFQLVLTGEDDYGGKLSREITVKTRQYGIRFAGNQYGVYGAYVGAFYRYDQSGERIISMQLPRWRDSAGNYTELGLWDAEVMPESRDLITLSTTPSFDPAAGTENPGAPEQYRVIANEFKYYDLDRKRNAPGGGRLIYQGWETDLSQKTIVAGRGRVYFRIGWKDGATSPGSATDQPVYARIRLTHTQASYSYHTNNYPDMPGYIIYVRKGEAADYIMRPADPIEDGPATGARTAAKKFAAFNLTASGLTGNYVQLAAPDVNGGKGVFVNYPSQGGAFFQWGLATGSTYPNLGDISAYFRRAYHPTKPNHPSSGYPSSGYWAVGYPSGYIPVWADTPTNDSADPDYGSYTGGYGATHEVCPKGYHRPSDGYTDRISYNGKYPNYVLEDGTGRYVNPNVITSASTYADVATTTQQDYSSQIAQSEWRQSLWRNPWAGESGGGSTGAATNSTSIKVTRESYSPKYVLGAATLAAYDPANPKWDVNLYLQYGFYADGFFDRRPVKVLKMYDGSWTPRYGVSLANYDAAFIGSLVYNPDSYASVFLPAAGRRNNSPDDNSIIGGALLTIGNAGYYWSSSAAPTTPKSSGMNNRTAWGIHMSYTDPGHIYTTTTYGYSVRCVAD